MEKNRKPGILKVSFSGAAPSCTQNRVKSHVICFLKMEGMHFPVYGPTMPAGMP